MGNQFIQSNKKILTIDNLTQQISKCKELGERKCPVYGELHQLLYQGKEIQIGKSLSTESPNPLSLHYLISPNILLIPTHCLLQDIKFSQYQKKKQLIQLILGITELQSKTDVGLSCHRAAFNYFTKKWCVLGDVGNGLWNYQALMKNNAEIDVYLSPELMKALSKDQLYPKINVQQSDIFIFAVMLLQIMTQKKLQPQIYNFNTSEINLAPIVEALLGIQQIFGKQIYELLVRMLELLPENRLSFVQLKEQVVAKLRVQDFYMSPITQKLNMNTPNVRPKLDSFSPSPQIVKTNLDNSKTRGRSPGAIKKNLIIVDRQNNKKPFSPIKLGTLENNLQTEPKRNSLINHQRTKRLSNGYKITPNRVKIWEGMDKQRPKVQPFGLRFEQTREKQIQDNQGERKSFSRLKKIRF